MLATKHAINYGCLCFDVLQKSNEKHKNISEFGRLIIPGINNLFIWYKYNSFKKNKYIVTRRICFD